MQYLTVQRFEGEKIRELNVISLQQVVGKHISLFERGTLRELFLKKAEENPDKFRLFKENLFCILDTNGTNITYSGDGKCPWTFLIGRKGYRRLIQLLFIGPRMWGIEMDMGMKMRVNATKLGNDRLISFLTNQVSSMIETPEHWESVEIFMSH